LLKAFSPNSNQCVGSSPQQIGMDEASEEVELKRTTCLPTKGAIGTKGRRNARDVSNVVTERGDRHFREALAR
jgi:hypothetical protein